jgi:hypothetical protein
MRLRFEPTKVPPGAARAPSAALDAATVGGAESAVAGLGATTGGCGEAMGASVVAESVDASRGEEIGVGGGRKREERALKFLSHQRLARDGVGLGFPFRPPQVQVAGARMEAPPKNFAGQRRMEGLFYGFFRPQPANRRLICGSGLDGGSARVSLMCCAVTLTPTAHHNIFWVLFTSFVFPLLKSSRTIRDLFNPLVHPMLSNFLKPNMH